MSILRCKLHFQCLLSSTHCCFILFHDRGFRGILTNAILIELLMVLGKTMKAVCRNGLRTLLESGSVILCSQSGVGRMCSIQGTSAVVLVK